MVLTNSRSLHLRDHGATGHDLTGGALTSGPFCSRSPGSSTCRVGPGCFLGDGAPHIPRVLTARVVAKRRAWSGGRAPVRSPVRSRASRLHLCGGGLRALLSL